LTPVAQKSAYLLAKRISLIKNKSINQQEYEKTKLDYKDFPTTVFTPIEYSCCGMSYE
jgi:hypothetical protein